MPNLINQNNNMNESKINTKINEILKEFNAIEKSISENSSNNFEQNKSIFEKYSELKKIADSIKLAMVVPGSGPVKQQAEQEGLDKIFLDAGFEWRNAGCSMCLAMNPDHLEPGERSASTSNRNFEGRQGKGGRTHLVSPQMAAAAAIAGHFVDIRDWVG